MKARLYATHAVPEYWVVDLVGNRVWRHRQPSGSRYAERTEIAERTVNLPGQLGEIVVTDLF